MHNFIIPGKMKGKEFIIMMATLMSVVAISIDAMLPALGIIRESFNTTNDNQVQFIISCIFAGMAVGQLFFGPLSDAVGRKKVLYICLAIYFFGSTLCLLSDDLETMLLGRFIQGLGVAGPYISCMAIIRDCCSGRAMARIMSLVFTIFITVPVFAPAIGQFIVLNASWHYIFVFYIAYALIVGLWVMFRLEETLPPEKRVKFTFANIQKDLRIVLTNRATVCYTLCLACVFAALIGDLNSAQQIFQEQYQVGEMFVVYFGLQALAFGGSSLLNSRWVEKYGMRYICLRALLMMTGISFVFLAIQLVMPIPFWAFFVYGVIVLFCVGLVFGNLNALALEPMGNIAGLATAIIGAISNIIAIPIGTLIGQYYDGSLLPLLLGFALLGSSAIAICRIAEQKTFNEPLL